MRVDFWDRQLTLWARDQVGKPFSWGSTDCAALVRAALHVMYGREMLPDLPTWSTLTEAITVLQAHPVPDMLQQLGARVVAPNFERAGDILLWKDPDHDQLPALGIRFSFNLLITDPAHGVTAPPSRNLTAAFRAAATAYRVPVDG